MQGGEAYAKEKDNPALGPGAADRGRGAGRRACGVAGLAGGGPRRRPGPAPGVGGQRPGVPGPAVGGAGAGGTGGRSVPLGQDGAGPVLPAGGRTALPGARGERPAPVGERRPAGAGPPGRGRGGQRPPALRRRPRGHHPQDHGGRVLRQVHHVGQRVRLQSHGLRHRHTRPHPERPPAVRRRGGPQSAYLPLPRHRVLHHGGRRRVRAQRRPPHPGHQPEHGPGGGGDEGGVRGGGHRRGPRHHPL